MTVEVATPAEQHPQLEQLIAVMAQLRAPGGCAWDAEQTHRSLARYLLEETYELLEAIESGDRDELIEELGDVLYQVLFHSDIAAHTPGEDFTIEDVAAHMTAKMVGRHPHVFGDAGTRSADQVAAVWEDLKRVEKPHRTSVLDGVPAAMPALALADKIIGKAAKADVAPDTATTIARAGELPVFSTEAELGDVLMAVTAQARAQGLDPESALRGAIRDLESRVRDAERGRDGALP